MSTKGKGGRPRTERRAARAAARKVAKKARAAGAATCVVNGVEIPPEWLELLLLLPGYDPRHHAVHYEVQKDGTTRAFRCWFDVKAAEHALGFIQAHCRHVKGEKSGKPVLLERWQQSVVANLFGWKREDGKGGTVRRYRTCLIYVPRKNGKTTLAACIVLYLLVCDREYGAEVYSAAGAKEQAAKIWEMLEAMRQLNDELRVRTQSYSQGKAITYPAYSCTYRAVPSDAKLQHGGDSHGVVIDELHVLKDNEELVEVLTTSVGSRAQPMIVYLTTADFAGESVCNRTVALARDVIRNHGDRARPGYDAEFLPVVYEATTSDDWTKPATWAKANPNLGVSLRDGYVASAVQAALRSPTKRNTFLRLQLNVQTDADVAWVPMELWDACAGPASWQQLAEKLKGADCYGGLDLASRRDLASFALFFPEHLAFLWWCWMPEQRARDLAMDNGNTTWLTWAEQHALELCPGRSISQQQIRGVIRGASERYRIREVGFDRWNAAVIRKWLQEDGLDVVEFGQGYRDLSDPSKELEQLWLDGKLVHGGHPVARQCAANTMVREDEAGNIKPNKAKSTGPIDPIVAAIMALGGALTAEPLDEGSVYEGRGVIQL